MCDVTFQGCTSSTRSVCSKLPAAKRIIRDRPANKTSTGRARSTSAPRTRSIATSAPSQASPLLIIHTERRVSATRHHVQHRPRQSADGQRRQVRLRECARERLGAQGRADSLCRQLAVRLGRLLTFCADTAEAGGRPAEALLVDTRIPLRRAARAGASSLPSMRCDEH